MRVTWQDVAREKGDQIVLRGIVRIKDRDVLHVIPRAEVRHVMVNKDDESGGAWVLHYQLATSIRGDVTWYGDCRPETLKDRITISEYNKLSADAVMMMLTEGYRDIFLRRREDGIFVVRSGLLEDDQRVELCRKFIAEMALTARQTAVGPLDEARREMLGEIQDAAQDLTLPDWYPLKEEQH